MRCMIFEGMDYEYNGSSFEFRSYSAGEEGQTQSHDKYCRKLLSFCIVEIMTWKGKARHVEFFSIELKNNVNLKSVTPKTYWCHIQILPPQRAHNVFMKGIFICQNFNFLRFFLPLEGSKFKTVVFRFYILKIIQCVYMMNEFPVS